MNKKIKILIVFLIFLLMLFWVYFKTHSPWIQWNNKVDEIEKIINTVWTWTINNQLEVNNKIKTEQQIEIEKKILNIKVSTWTTNWNTTFNKVSINSNINNLIEIYNWNDLEYIEIDKNIFTVIKEENKTYFWIDEWTLKTWNYIIYTIDKNNIKTELSFKLSSFYDTNLINIVNITPNSLKNDKARYIVVQWSWFNKIIWIQLNNNIILHKTTFEIVNDKVMMIKIPEKLDIWDYYFNIMATDSIYKLDKNIFTITN